MAKDPDSLTNEVAGEEDEEEALSLCDLPILNEENQPCEEAAHAIEAEEDFDFGSCAVNVSTVHQMCAADDVFFQGQILPLRHSVSSDTRYDNRYPTRSESMDHCYMGGFRSASSRSSSITSHHSSSSSSTATTTRRYNPRTTRNQFHSHPSPTPQIRSSSFRQGNVGSQRIQKSTMWSFFQVGLVRAPEMGLPDLNGIRNKNNTNKNFGSRNSTSSTGSNNIEKEKKKKKKQLRLFDRYGALFGGCKCSVNAVEAEASRMVVVKRSMSVKEEGEKATRKKKKTKQAMSRHRTFEWLKQLSLEGGPDGE